MLLYCINLDLFIQTNECFHYIVPIHLQRYIQESQEVENRSGSPGERSLHPFCQDRFKLDL